MFRRQHQGFPLRGLPIGSHSCGAGLGSFGGTMKYRQFLFDLDDTLLDFQSSENLSFDQTMAMLGLAENACALYADYRTESARFWAEFERGRISKEVLRVERFRRAFKRQGIDADPITASALYLDILPETVVLIEGAREVCDRLAGIGELGIITNGIEAVQRRRIERSGLGAHFCFVATSEGCGHAKPDPRIFEFAAGHFQRFAKPEAIIIGDRIESDIAGAINFGIDSCWLNPSGLRAGARYIPTFEVSDLGEIGRALGA